MKKDAMPDLGEKPRSSLEALRMLATARVERDEARQQLANLRAALETAVGEARRSDNGRIRGFVWEQHLRAILADPACGGSVHGRDASEAGSPSTLRAGHEEMRDET